MAGKTIIAVALLGAAGVGYFADDLGGAGMASYAISQISPSCRIKGNISINTGERIYHVPGQKHYKETRISPSYGERWFCSEDEARAAGWRRARTSELARLIQAPVYDIPNALGGLSILNWTNPIRGDAAPIQDMWTQLEADMQAVLAILGSGAKVGFFFWNQGESDNSQTVDWYYKELHDVLLPALRAKSWWSPSGRIVLQGKTSLPMRMTGSAP